VSSVYRDPVRSRLGESIMSERRSRALHSPPRSVTPERHAASRFVSSVSRAQRGGYTAVESPPRGVATGPVHWSAWPAGGSHRTAGTVRMLRRDASESMSPPHRPQVRAVAAPAVVTRMHGHRVRARCCCRVWRDWAVARVVLSSRFDYASCVRVSCYRLQRRCTCEMTLQGK
jgi:hypothetical protein